MASTCLYKSLTETATDLLFQDCVLAVLGIPFAAVVLNVTVGGATTAGCKSSAFHSYNDVLFESGSPLSLFWGGAVGLIVSGSILLFVGVAMLWKFRFLKRALIILVAIPCMASFASSWLLWIGKSFHNVLFQHNRFGGCLFCLASTTSICFDSCSKRERPAPL